MFGSDQNEKDTYRPETQNSDRAAPGVLMITGDKVEDLEFFYPYYRFIEAGYRVDVATLDGGKFEAKHGLGLKSSRKLEEVRAEDYALLYLPGGKAPETLKKNEKVLAIVKNFTNAGKPVAAICHGPQILAAAGVIRGKRIAAWPEVENEVKEAGGIYENKETVCDGLFVTARWPADLPSHMKATLKILAEAKSGTSKTSPIAA